MLRNLFISILILSTFASEGGVCYSEELVKYYLANFTYLDVMQNSINSVPDFNINRLGTAEKKGTPLAFYKLISQDSIDSKSPKRNIHQEALWICFIIAGIVTFCILYICLNNKLFIITRRHLLCLADSSPPAFC